MTRPIGNVPPSVPIGNQSSSSGALASAAPTSAAIGRALGAGTDQEKVLNLIPCYSPFTFHHIFINTSTIV